MSKVGVLVVEDFEPIRRFVCSTLKKNPELQVIGEVSDGLEAVQKAEELQPDLVVLDIGLPSLHGIEAARRILKLSPQSKILFVSPRILCRRSARNSQLRGTGLRCENEGRRRPVACCGSGSSRRTVSQ